MNHLMCPMCGDIHYIEKLPDEYGCIKKIKFGIPNEMR